MLPEFLRAASTKFATGKSIISYEVLGIFISKGMYLFNLSARIVEELDELVPIPLDFHEIPADIRIIFKIAAEILGGFSKRPADLLNFCLNLEVQGEVSCREVNCRSLPALNIFCSSNTLQVPRGCNFAMFVSR